MNECMTKSAGSSIGIGSSSSDMPLTLSLYMRQQQQAYYSQQGSTQLSSMQQFWMLAGRLPTGQTDVAATVCGFCKLQGVQRISKITNNATAVAAIQDVLELQFQVANLIRSLAAGAQELLSLKQVWESVANTHTTPSIAESLAKYLDMILRSTKRMDSLQEDWLVKTIGGLFVLMQAKDVFEAFYKRDLAKRLLLNRIISMGVGRQVVALFKVECETGYTSKMKGMFQDMEWSRQTMVVSRQSTVSNPATGVDMETQLVTTGYWPVYPVYPNLNLLDTLKQPQEHFIKH